MRLMVTMLDTFRTSVAICHEGEHVPYGRRVVEIPLEPWQVELLTPRVVGVSNGRDVREEIGPSWLQTEPALTERTP